MGQTDSGKLIDYTRNVYLFERRASTDSDFWLDQALDMLEIKEEKLYEDFNEEFNEDFNEE